MKFETLSSLLRAPLYGAALLALFAVSNARAARAAEPEPDQGPEAAFTDAIYSEVIDRLQPLLNPENMQTAPAIAVINEILPKAAPETFDWFALNNMKGKLLLKLGADDPAYFAQAAAVMESLYPVVMKYPQFMPQPGELLDLTRNLATTFLNVAQDQEGDTRTQSLAKADKYMTSYMENAPALSSDDFMGYGFILLQEMGDPPDMQILDRAEKALEDGLRANANPRWQMVQYLVNLKQLKGDLATAADYLEMLLQFQDQYMQPGKEPTPAEGTHWQSLAGTYTFLAVTLSDGEPDPDDDPYLAEEYMIRAIHTYKRAQARGFLDKPEDYNRLISFYFELNQIGLAAQTLEDALNTGKVDASDPTQWSYLANYYTLMEKHDRSIEVLKEAASRFPDYGKFDRQLFQVYFDADDLASAYEYAVAAANKGVDGQEGLMWMSAAFCAYSLKQYDDAYAALLKAEVAPDSKGDPRIGPMKEQIEGQLEARRKIQESIKGGSN